MRKQQCRLLRWIEPARKRQRQHRQHHSMCRQHQRPERLCQNLLRRRPEFPAQLRYSRRGRSRPPGYAGCRCQRLECCIGQSPNRDCSPARGRSHPSMRDKACLLGSVARAASSSQVVAPEPCRESMRGMGSEIWASQTEPARRCSALRLASETVRRRRVLSPKVAGQAFRKRKRWRLLVVANENPGTSRCVDLRRLTKGRIGRIAYQPSVSHLNCAASVSRICFRVSNLHDSGPLLV